jgi:hypothetical protein
MSNDLGLDRSGNNNHWVANNMATYDQMLDTPTNNFCTLNPVYANRVKCTKVIRRSIKHLVVCSHIIGYPVIIISRPV